MERLTRMDPNNHCHVTDGIAGKYPEGGYYGEAIERLAQYENLVDHLLARQQHIPEELETLREAGKNKTVQFKELLTQKLITENFLALLMNRISR